MRETPYRWTAYPKLRRKYKKQMSSWRIILNRKRLYYLHQQFASRLSWKALVRLNFLIGQNAQAQYRDQMMSPSKHRTSNSLDLSDEDLSESLMEIVKLPHFM